MIDQQQSSPSLSDKLNVLISLKNRSLRIIDQLEEIHKEVLEINKENEFMICDLMLEYEEYLNVEEHDWDKFRKAIQDQSDAEYQELKDLLIDNHGSHIKVKCDACLFVFYVNFGLMVNFNILNFMIGCPKCSRQYDYNPDKDEWFCDRRLVILEREE